MGLGDRVLLARGVVGSKFETYVDVITLALVFRLGLLLLPGDPDP